MPKEKIMGGYIIKARCIYESEVRYMPPVAREVWDWLLMNVNHKPKKTGKYIIQRGQKLLKYNDIMDGLSWKIGFRTERYSIDSMKGAMKALRKAAMITTTKTPYGIIVTILNYEKYQDISNYEGSMKQPLNGHIDNPASPPANGTKNEKKKRIYQKLSGFCDNDILDFVYNFQENAEVEHGALSIALNETVVERGVKTVGRLIRIDGFTKDQIFAAIRWGYKDPFWNTQIRSIAALRSKSKNDMTKFQNLFNSMQKTSAGQPKVKKSEIINYDENGNRI